MAEQQFKQFRYFGGNNSNQNNISAEELINGEIFSQYRPIVQLGIRTLPGTRFYLNDGDSPVIVGYTGLFELEFKEGGCITSMRFARQSIDFITDNINGGYLIIDILGKGGN